MSREPVQVNDEGRVAAHLQTARTALQAAYRLIRDDRETEAETTPGQVLDQVRTAQDLIDLAGALQTHRLAQHAGTITAQGPAHDEFLDDADVEDTADGRAGEKSGGQDPATAAGGQPPASAGRTRWAARGQVPAAEEIDPVRCADIAALLQWGPRTTARRLREAVTAINQLPDLVDALAEGAIDVARLGAVAVADALADLDADARRDAGPVLQHAMLHGTRGGISAWTPTSTRQRAKAAVAELDRYATQAQRRRAITEALGVSFAPARSAAPAP